MKLIQVAFDLLPLVIGLTTAIAVIILAPLTIFRRSRPFAAAGLLAASSVLGAALWVYGAVATFLYWGIIGLGVGLILVGVGVVPMGLLALALQSQWEWCGQLGILLISVVGFRLLAMWAIAHSPEPAKSWATSLKASALPDQ